MPSNSSLAAQAEALLIGKFPLTEAFANNPTVHLTAKATLSLTRKPALFHLNTFFLHHEVTKSQSHKGFFNLHLLTFFCVFCALCG
jgi:hypothetical protein